MRRYESQDRVEVDFDVAALGENVRAKAERRLWGKWLGLRTQELTSIGVRVENAAQRVVYGSDSCQQSAGVGGTSPIHFPCELNFQHGPWNTLQGGRRVICTKTPRAKTCMF